MTDVKISSLPLATTPLAGTEVLPIVQSATTDQVSVANLTAGRAVSALSLTLTGTPLAVGSGGTGLTSLTAGYIPFGAGTSAFGNSSNLFWDSANNRLGIGTASPSVPLVVGTNYASYQASLVNFNGTGSVQFNQSGMVSIGATNSTAVDVGGSLSFSAYDSILSAPYPCGTISGRRESGTTGNYSGYFAIATTNSAGTIAEKLRVDSAGNLLVGTTGVYGKIAAWITSDLGTIASAGSANNIGFSIQNTASGAVSTWNIFSSATGSGFGAGLFAIARGVNVPALYITSADLIYAPATYNSTTATAANMVINSGGLIQRSTSSRRYKTNIIDAVHGLSDLLKLRSVTYNGINDGDKIFGGLIAEEVDAAGLPEFVVYDDEGKPDALHYGNMAGLFVKAIQELAAKVQALEAKVQ